MRTSKLLIFITFYNFIILFAQYSNLKELFEIETKTKYLTLIYTSSSMAPYFNKGVHVWQIISGILPNMETVSIYEFAKYLIKISSKQAKDIKQPINYLTYV